jgi:hypothetical protein
MKRIILVLIHFQIVVLITLPQFVAANSNLNAAIGWLKQNQKEDGSYGPWTEHWTSPTMIALYKSEGNSSNVMKGLNWLKSQLEDSSSWFWGAWGEADIPSIALYAFTQTDHVSGIDVSGISSNILSFQQMSGGFKGYYDSSLQTQVESSVDTATALLGLINANAIPEENKTKALNYLLNLQNSDGSFNLTSNVQSDPLYSQGPESISLIAIVLLALKDCGVNTPNISVLNGINYLKNSSINCFNNHSYAVALSAIVFNRFNELSYELVAIECLKNLQNSDGGFSDRIRTTNVSNSLDTGWAAIALQETSPLVKVGFLTMFPNGTTFAHCLQLPNGSSAEDALKASGMKTLWASFSFGDALTKIEDVGCPTSDSWCECSDMNVCCLLWNFWILNSTNQWEFSQVGYGDYKLKDKDVFGSIWTSDAGKKPPLFLFDEICPDGFTVNNNSFVDAYTCNSCTSDEQCLSGDCCNGVCQKTSLTCCGEDGCEMEESCSSCPQDCGSCPTTVQEIVRGGGYIKTTTTTMTTTTTTSTTTTTIFSSTSTTTSTIPTNVTNIQSKRNPLTGFVTFIISPVGIGMIVVIIVLAFFVYLMLPKR